jgi:hypothetical protein
VVIIKPTTYGTIKIQKIKKIAPVWDINYFESILPNFGGGVKPCSHCGVLGSVGWGRNPAVRVFSLTLRSLGVGRGVWGRARPQEK